MIIHHVQWYPIRIPLPTSFDTAHQQLAYREGAIIEIHTDIGVTGVGEIAPLPEFAGGRMQDVLLHLPHIAERLHGVSLSEAILLLRERLGTLPSSATYGIETALLDVQGQYEGRSLSTLLAQSHFSPGSSEATRSRIAINTVIGIMGVGATVRRAQSAVAAGFGCIKLKVSGDVEFEVGRIEAVRAAIGPAIDLRLDANEGWTRAQAQYVLGRCADFNIQYVEQPLARDDLEGMRMLRESVPVPIAADEALSDLASAQRVLAARAADIFIIKPQLSGGLYNAQRMLRLANENGLRCVITSSIEAGIGIAAALHLAAASPEVTLACGLGTLPLLANDLISGELPIYKGEIRVPDSPGLGVTLDRAALATFSTSQ